MVEGNPSLLSKKQLSITRAAEEGFSQTMTHLGLMHEKGENLIGDLEIAQELYLGAAKRNTLLDSIISGASFSYTEAAEWLRSAIHRDKTFKDAYFSLALPLSTRPDWGQIKTQRLCSNTSVRRILLRLASESVVPKTSTKCGNRLYSEEGVLRPIKTEAVQYLKKAIEQGDTQALYTLALVYESVFDGTCWTIMNL